MHYGELTDKAYGMSNCTTVNMCRPTCGCVYVVCLSVYHCVSVCVSPCVSMCVCLRITVCVCALSVYLSATPNWLFTEFCLNA